jgi:hypothetical protein
LMNLHFFSCHLFFTMPKDLDVCTDVPTDTLVDYGQPQPVMDEGVGLKEGTRSDCQAPAPQDWTTTYTAYAKGHVQGTFAPLFPLKMCPNPSVAAERVRTRANDEAGEPGADHKPADQLLLVPRFPIWVPAPLTPTRRCLRTFLRSSRPNCPLVGTRSQDVYRDNVDGMPFKMGMKGILSGTSTKLTAENINWIQERIAKCPVAAAPNTLQRTRPLALLRTRRLAFGSHTRHRCHVWCVCKQVHVSTRAPLEVQRPLHRSR